MQNVTLAISGMSCGHCVAAVAAALGDVPGVTVGRVAIGSAAITIDPAVASVEAAVEAVEDAGYAAQVATVDGSAAARPSGRSLPLA